MKGTPPKFQTHIGENSRLFLFLFCFLVVMCIGRWNVWNVGKLFSIMFVEFWWVMATSVPPAHGCVPRNVVIKSGFMVWVSDVWFVASFGTMNVDDCCCMLSSLVTWCWYACGAWLFVTQTCWFHLLFESCVSLCRLPCWIKTLRCPWWCD